MNTLKNFDVKNQIKLSENRLNLHPQSENSKKPADTNSYDNFADCRDDEKSSIRITGPPFWSVKCK